MESNTLSPPGITNEGNDFERLFMSGCVCTRTKSLICTIQDSGK